MFCFLNEHPKITHSHGILLNSVRDTALLLQKKACKLKCFSLIFSEERFNLDLKLILKYYSIVLTSKNHKVEVTD